MGVHPLIGVIWGVVVVEVRVAAALATTASASIGDSEVGAMVVSSSVGAEWSDNLVRVAGAGANAAAVAIDATRMASFMVF